MADTALTIIEGGMRHLGALEVGASASYDEANDGLRALNGMLGKWALDGLPLYGETLTTHTLVASTASYTIGSGATIDAARPTGLKGIRGAWVRDSNNIDRPIRHLISFKRYQDIAQKSTTSPYPNFLAIDPGTTTSTLYLYPTPSTGNTLRLLYEALITFAATTTSFSLPPGYQEAIEYNLALRLAPMFELEPSAMLVMMAADALDSIERVNAVSRIGKLKTDVPLMGGAHYDIDSDTWN